MTSTQERLDKVIRDLTEAYPMIAIDPTALTEVLHLAFWSQDMETRHAYYTAVRKRLFSMGLDVAAIDAGIDCLLTKAYQPP